MVIKRSKGRQGVAEVQKLPEEAEALERTLRPRRLQDYIGQVKIKEHLLVYMGAAKSRSEPLGHTLLHGPPGVGKTTLAFIIGQEMGAQVRTTSGPAVEKPGDLASLLTNLQHDDVLFIDEIHRMRPQLEEMLYSAMEDSVLDIMIGKGPSARSVRLNLQPFTLIGATTKVGAVSAPLRDRFLHTFKLGFYELSEMQQIIERSAGILGMVMETRATFLLAQASRATPRVGNRLVRAVRDFSAVRGSLTVAMGLVEDTLHALDVDPDGLDATDRGILRILVEDFRGGPVGLSTLAAILAEEEETLEEVYEPYLLQQGYLQRTPKGRMVTQKAYQKLGFPLPEEKQSRAF